MSTERSHVALFLLCVVNPVFTVRLWLYFENRKLKNNDRSDNTSNHSDVEYLLCQEAIVIIWWLDFPLPMQSVPITTNVVSWNPVHGEVYLIQHHVIESLSVT